MRSESADFRHIGERVRFTGSFLTLAQATFVDPDGFTFEREIVRHPGAVCVVPLEADGDVLMVRQYRAPLDRSILEVPAGKLDVIGEELEAAARRELAEEVGRQATKLTDLGGFYNSPGFTDEYTTCFLAEGLTLTPRSSQGVEEQHMTIEAVPLAEVFDRFDVGGLVDAKSVIALTLTRRLLRARANNA